MAVNRKGMAIKDETSKVYGRLTVLSRANNRKGRSDAYWECQCNCGTLIVIRGRGLREGVKSCGCIRKEMFLKLNTTHGKSNTTTHVTWTSMKQRCNNPKAKRFKDYGGRGIKVCERWDSFDNFLADMGERPTGLSLDRIDVNGNYEPSNCRWATDEQQRANTTRTRTDTINGITRTLREWAKEYNRPFELVRSRLRIGWDLKRALTQEKTNG